jgi:hypothetical protein
MPLQDPETIGYGYVIERCLRRKGSGHTRYREPTSAKEWTGNNGGRKRQQATTPNPDSLGVRRVRLTLGCEAAPRAPLSWPMGQRQPDRPRMGGEWALRGGVDDEG